MTEVPLYLLWVARAPYEPGITYVISDEPGRGTIYSTVEKIRQIRQRGRDITYRGTSLTRNRTTLGPYAEGHMVVLGGWVFSYEQGTPVLRTRTRGRAASTGGDAVESMYFAGERIWHTTRWTTTLSSKVNVSHAI